MHIGSLGGEAKSLAVERARLAEANPDILATITREHRAGAVSRACYRPAGWVSSPSSKLDRPTTTPPLRATLRRNKHPRCNTYEW